MKTKIRFLAGVFVGFIIVITYGLGETNGYGDGLDYALYRTESSNFAYELRFKFNREKVDRLMEQQAYERFLRDMQFQYSDAVWKLDRTKMDSIDYAIENYSYKN